MVQAAGGGAPKLVMNGAYYGRFVAGPGGRSAADDRILQGRRRCFAPDTPRLWSPATYRPPDRLDPFALHPDGKRVAIPPTTTNSELQRQIVFFFDFPDFLKNRK